MSEHALHTPQIKRLERSRTDKVLAGVSGGLGRYFDMTPAVFRLGFVVLTVLGGAGILVYIAAVLVMPKEGEDQSIAEEILSNRRDHPARLVALGLVAVAILSLLAHAGTWPTAGTAWALLVIGGLMFLWTRRRGGLRGILLVIATLVALMFVVFVAAVTIAFAWFNVSLSDGTGNRTYIPATSQEIHGTYHLGIGKLVVDLSNVRNANVHTRLGIGDLRIIVPQGTPVRVDARVKAGSIDALGEHDNGTNAHVVSGAQGGLTVDARVGAGHIEVERAQ